MSLLCPLCQNLPTKLAHACHNRIRSFVPGVARTGPGLRYFQQCAYVNQKPWLLLKYSHKHQRFTAKLPMRVHPNERCCAWHSLLS